MTDVPALERTHFTEFWIYPFGLNVRSAERLGIFEFTTSDGYIYSKAFICPTCGRLWGRVNHVISNQPDLHHSYEAITGPCPRHGGGSLIDDIHELYIHMLPRALLIYEILETSYDGKRPDYQRRLRASPTGQPNAPHGATRHRQNLEPIHPS